ncbi:DUF1380 family protein [Pantoea agglomerans]|uniref:DUF1380 family protein n=1 Tax=Enterobacter agglomerans TaxID=549 RepID=UPI000DAC2E0F|nr:DUF1380 family protein [Pantoea agglomerans]RAH26735.1 hypothetical protein DOT37_23125 [Pantoea agglomerans]TGX88536.1 DUF1380 domain-containing protein [Pantoea agglomerans]
MYGTVNELCARLKQRFKSDELMTLIIWTKEDVLAVLDDSRITQEAADEILRRIEWQDDQHDKGVGLDVLQSLAQNLLDEAEQAREATVPAAALETAIRVAWDFMRLEDAQNGEGASARRFPAETAALCRISALLREQSGE